jgi:hypothetical protein
MNTTGESHTGSSVGGSISVFGGVAIGAAMYAFQWIAATIPWSAAFIFLRSRGIKLYMLTGREECKRILKRIKNSSSHTGDNERGYGYAFGKWYFLHASTEYRDDHSIWMIATDSSYKELTRDISDDDDLDSEVVAPVIEEPIVKATAKKKLDVLVRHGPFENIWYRKRLIKNLNVKPFPEQRIIMDRIRTLYEEKNRAVVYIHGAPATGKSMIGQLLAEEYGASYTNSCSPWEPGDAISIVVDEIDGLSKDNPLIVAFEEIDGALLRIHEGIPNHKNIATQITDKSSWNRFLDNFSRGLYPYVILIMTSNRPVEFINALDTTYLRKGRVDEIFEMGIKME